MNPWNGSFLSSDDWNYLHRSRFGGGKQPYNKEDYPLWKSCDIFFKILGNRPVTLELIDNIMSIMEKQNAK